MMKAGDEVRIRSTGAIGVIAEIDGDIAYIDMDNGVEMSMFLSDIILESKYVTKFEKQTRRSDEETVAKHAISQEVIDVLYEQIIRLGQWAHASASSAVIALGGGVSAWESLNAYQKMNFISVATAIPVDVWFETFKKDDGSLGKLQLTALSMFSEQMKGLNR